MIFYGEKQKSMLDEEQTVPDAIDTDDLDSDEDECDETSAESSIYDGCSDEELLVHIRSCEGDEALDYLINKYR